MQIQDSVDEHFRVLAPQKKALKKLRVETIEDLLWYFPRNYGSTPKVRDTKNIEDGEYVTLYGTIDKLKTRKSFRGGIPMAEGTFKDDSGQMKVIWFSQPYIAKMIPNGSLVKIQGKVANKKITNPEIEKITEIPLETSDSLFGEGESSIFPVYKETKGITSRWIYHTIQKIFKEGLELDDPIPDEILKEYNLPKLQTALIWIHAPRREEHYKSARKRFAFEEIFFIQLEKEKEKLLHKQNPTFQIFKEEKDTNEFIKRFPFEPTNSQRDAIDKILSDFRKDYAMSRLLEGDVGSGKTAVAATTAFAVVTTPPKNQDFGNLQVAYMAPTEILAEQHFESFIEYFSYLGINIGLITSSGCRKFPSKINPKKWTDISRSQLLKWVANGEIPILIGTHSLIQKTVSFENLAYTIIDEQHRFGTKQRQKLRKKKDEILPHLLSMTATPIPRTLALTIYGDLDLTLLDEMPKGRKPVITETILPNRRDDVYQKIREEIKEGRQAYVICPRIDEPDPDKQNAMNVKSVKAEKERLERDIFPNLKLDMLHG
ncbi:MAG: DEAD/DEAH box helicase, partial [Candidatus Pacebacteria bacterium]|nr:DEAD/DEAH box helicase [Candidatus Paceibacterota bacterium]